MTTEPGRPPALDDLASLARQHLAAIAASLTERGITSRLTLLGDTPVLTIDEPDSGMDSPTVAVDSDTSGGAGLRLDCTCIWTPAPGSSATATADTILTVLNAVRPAREGA
ncbi:MAG: hypothetical protein ACRDOL_38995 [Streptosporangiaceae bacterium]